jgi:hypothetical protein
LILEGRNPGEEHKEKKNELARLDADIAKLQVEAQGIASAMVSQAHVQCAEFQNQVLASRRKVGEKLLEFVTAWIELGRMTAEFGDAKSRREFNAYLEGQAKGVGLLKIDRLDPNGAIPLQPSWSWNSIRAGNFDEALKQMVKELTGYPFQQ